MSKYQGVKDVATSPLTWGVAGLGIGFLMCWLTLVMPMQKHLNAREDALKKWEDINRQERESISTLKTINEDRLRQWMATLDEQNIRYSQLQRDLHAKEMQFAGPAYGYMLIALLAVLGVAGFIFWMVRDGNADAARTLENAASILPSLRASITEHRVEHGAIESQAQPIQRIASQKQAPALEASQEQQGTIREFLPAKGFGFIAPKEGGSDIFFHESELKSQRPPSGLIGRAVTFTTGRDNQGRPCARNVRLAD